MIGGPNQFGNNHVIQESQNECESSFKTENTGKDIVHQYFEFLHKEVSNFALIFIE